MGGKRGKHQAVFNNIALGRFCKNGIHIAVNSRGKCHIASSGLVRIQSRCNTKVGVFQQLWLPNCRIIRLPALEYVDDMIVNLPLDFDKTQRGLADILRLCDDYYGNFRALLLCIIIKPGTFAKW